MSDMPDKPRPLIDALRERSGVIIAIFGLVAWVAMLWAMFGDVL